MIHADQTQQPCCPKCGCHQFTLTVTQLVDVEFEGDDHHNVFNGPSGDMEWDDDTDAICIECGHFGPLGKMK